MLFSVITALALCVGFYFGFKIGRTGDLPKIKTRKQIKEIQEENKEKRKFQKALNNLDTYDGTDKGQEEIV